MTATTTLEVYTVSRLNRQAKALLEQHFTPIWLEGEISNFKLHTSGHMYFALKDDRAQISAVMFAGVNRALTFSVRDGLKVMVRGNLTLYEARGQYQVVVENMYPAGAGELWLLFEELKGKLQAEGLFDPARKRPLPAFPRQIGVITSATGAAVQDILQVTGRRAPHVRVLVRPSLVQGDRAAPDIIAALKDFQDHGKIDLIIVARGGGSLEDLWPFNEEAVVRALADCPLPVISAVGHESDLTLCDLVADLRAPTPSAAAELAVGERSAYIQYLDEKWDHFGRLLRRQLTGAKEHLTSLEGRYGFRRPAHMIDRRKARLEELRERGYQTLRRLLMLKGEQVNALERQLLALSPEGVLQRGYARVTDEATGATIVRTGDLAPEQHVRLNFHDGRASARVTKVETS